MQKTAIFGGTFDPPHIGHKVMLEGLSRLDGIGEILVLPAKDPPHKERKIASFEDRVNMCRLAFADIKKVTIDLTEQSLPGKSYTLNTLEHFKSIGVKDPVLVIGGDSLCNFQRWYRYEDILKLAELYAYRRQGVSDASLLEAQKNLSAVGGRVSLLDLLPPEISSTEIRNLLYLGQDAAKLIPKEVNEYIIKKGLYNGTNF